MSKAPYFITGDAITSGYREVVVSIPNSQQNWVLNVFLGALDFMTKPESWITGGESEQADAAEAFQAIVENVRWMPIFPGFVQWSAAATIPSYAPYLLCDGTLYNGTDYPALYAAIGSTYNTGGEPSGYFRVPQLQGMTLAGVDPGNINLPYGWAGHIGGFGGEAEHVLIEAETPAHSHTDSGHSHGYTPAVPLATSVGLEPPEPSAIPGLGTTALGFANLDSFGADDAHINTQPTTVMFAYIYIGP